jgi:hypothetical protein
MQNSELYRRRGGKHKSLVTNETEESMEKLWRHMKINNAY